MIHSDETPPIRDSEIEVLLVRTLDTLVAYRERRARDGDGDILDASQAAHERYARGHARYHPDCPPGRCLAAE